MNKARENLKDQLEKITGHRFCDDNLFHEALTHRSYATSHSGLSKNYERLEFLGDRVLGLLITEMLYELYPDAPEGELSRRLTHLVCGPACAEIGFKLGLDKALILGAALEKKRNSIQASIIADACESLIGALYLSGGLNVARALVRHAWADKAAQKLNAERDAKTALQEWVQGLGYGLPVYHTTGREGPDHRPSFKVEVHVEGLDLSATGEAGNKKHAEQNAASRLLDQIKST